MTDKENGSVPEAGSSPYDEPTLQMRRDRPSRLESDDDLDLDGSSFESAPPYAPAPTEQIHRPAPAGAVTADEPPVAKVRRGTLDLGLLVLRLAVGGT
ncbi:DoxX family protein, partial [Rhodococcus sp. CC-R104]|nr:DoxX family protein [Rhodococcus sp. CC-R104]